MDNNIVTQSNSLIEAHYSFSLLEMQIFLYGLSLVNPFEKKCTLEYEVKINDFIKTFKKTSKNTHSEVKKTIKNKFWNSEFRIKYPQTGDFKFVRLLDELEYIEKESKFKISFSHKSRSFLIDLKSRFTSYDLRQISFFKSFYSIRLYEFFICELNASLKKKYTFKITLCDLKERLMLSGKYKKFKDFRRVLTKAQTEINTHSDLTIEFEEIKKGRRVESIKFIVQRKPGMPRASYAQEENNTEAPAYPPLVQDGNSAYKCSYTQATSKLSSNDRKVNAVMEESGYKSASYAKKLNHAQTATKEETADSAVVSQPQEALPQSQQNKNEASICDNDTNLSNLDAGCKRGYTEHQTLVAQMCKYGLKQKRALDLIEDYGAHFCEQGVAKMQKAIKDGYNINNSAAYLTTCITSSVELVKGSDEIKAEDQQEFIEEQLSCAALENILRNNYSKKAEALEA